MRSVLPAALLVSCVGLAGAAPPTLDFPADIRPANGYVVVEPKTDAVSVTYVALDGVYPFPAAMLKDAKTFALPVNGLADGRYRWMAVAAGKTGEQSSKELVVVIGTPADDKRPPVKPPVVVPPAAGPFYFLIVRPDGPADAAFSKALALPEWQTLRAAGHKVKDRTAAEAAGLGAGFSAGELPTVITLVVSADGKSSTVVGPNRPLPTTGPAVLKLVEVK